MIECIEKIITSNEYANEIDGIAQYSDNSIADVLLS